MPPICLERIASESERGDSDLGRKKEGGKGNLAGTGMDGVVALLWKRTRGDGEMGIIGCFFSVRLFAILLCGNGAMHLYVSLCVALLGHV